MTAPYYQDDSVTLYHGDCIAVMAQLEEAFIDAVVTDPPYGLEFMGKEWDAPWKHGFGDTGYSDAKRMARPNFGSTRNPMCRTCRQHQRGTKRCECVTPDYDERPADSNVAFQEWCESWAIECLRVLKPGGHMLAFGGTRTWHRLACAIEDAGFEIRDSIAWLYGSGFPKSLDVSKAIDKAARASGVAAIAPDAEQWEGWGTALKPAFEPIVVARKPLRGTVAGNVLEHGTGALNIDGCRVPTTDRWEASGVQSAPGSALVGSVDGSLNRSVSSTHEAGRWPTNVVLDDEMADELDTQTGVSVSRIGKPRGADPGEGWGMTHTGAEYADEGGASRFFPVFRYEAKAATDERPTVDGVAHPTVKPLDLMRWLVRLVTPPNGLVLDPFAGSGTTTEACIHEYKRCIAVEREPDYLPLIVARLSKPMAVGFDFGEAL